LINKYFETMKLSHSQLQKNIFAFMIFILLIQLSGCIVTKVIPSSDLPSNESNSYTFISSSGKVNHLLDSITISNGIFFGRIGTGIRPKGKGNNVYLCSDTVMKVNPENKILSIPLNSIAVAETTKVSGGKTSLLIFGCAAAGFFGGILGIAFIMVIGGGI
jgi:hypothetical protein